MASEEHDSEKSSPFFRGFTWLFLRKLQENLDRKNQNPGRRVVIKKLKPVYAYEISCMMHTLGDVEFPLRKSILYLETILRDQMNMLLIKASEVPDSGSLSHVQLLTLLANNREKMTRLLHYLYLKDSSDLLGKRKYEQFYVIDVVNTVQFGTRVKTCLAFLESIDAGDYDPESIKSRSDDIDLERIARKFQMSCKMSNEQYFSFSKKQSVCFYPKGNDGRFKDWLLNDNVIDLQPTTLALDILAFFARETIAEVVEAALNRRSKEHSTIDIPRIHIDNDSQSKVDPPEKLMDSDLGDSGSPSHSSGMLGLSSLFADCSDSTSKLSSLINTGVLGMSDIFAISTSPLIEKEIFSPTKESQNQPNVQEPKISARNSNDPITVEDLRSAVWNLIISSPGQIQINKTKRILCL